MAELVAAFGSSHSPLLNSPAEDYKYHADIDRGVTEVKRDLFDKFGQSCSYEDLLTTADAEIANQITPDVITKRVIENQAHIDYLGKEIASAELDAIIIVGDDQHEQFYEDNMPAMLVYWGDNIKNSILQLSNDAPDWWKRARSQFHEPKAPREYPVASELGLHLISSLIHQEFDISHSNNLPREFGEGHAFGFFHRRLMQGKVVPIVPVIINTYFPPNQPLPKRCYELGRAIRRGVKSWKVDARVGVLASGGLSHFTIDEELDRGLLEACRTKDAQALSSIPPNKLVSGNSEIRNWITVAGAAEHLNSKWQEYVPCYRSAAGTGCAMAFAVWG